MPRLPSGLLPHRAPRRLLDPPVRALARLGVTPNGVTTIGFLGNVLAGALAASGALRWAGAVLLCFSALDLLDGALARATGRVSAFGAVYDATLDRLSEAAVLCGLSWHFRHDEVVSLVIIAALLGSIGVSYVRARAETLGVQLREGLFTRAERVVLLALALLAGLAVPALWVLAVLTNLTALQRLWLAWRALGNRRSNTGGDTGEVAP